MVKMPGVSVGWLDEYLRRDLDFLVQDGLVTDLLSRMVCPKLLVGLKNMLACYQMVEGEMTGTRSSEMKKKRSSHSSATRLHTSAGIGSLNESFRRKDASTGAESCSNFNSHLYWAWRMSTPAATNQTTGA